MKRRFWFNSICDYLMVSPLFRFHPKYLVIASDGIWDVLEDQEVIDSINEYANTEDIAKQISQDAINEHSRDNIAILIISFEKNIVEADADEDEYVDEEDQEDDDDEHDEL